MAISQISNGEQGSSVRSKLNAVIDVVNTVVPASETAAGLIEIATQAEVTTGASDALAITPLKLVTHLTNNVWKIGGNALGAANWIGTSTGVDFQFRTSNTQRMVIEAGGNVGISVANPSAKLHIAAGSDIADGAPFKLTPGTLTTGANISAGAIELNGDKLYLTITTGISRKELALWDITSVAGGLVPFTDTNGRLTGSATFTFASTLNVPEQGIVIGTGGTLYDNAGNMSFTNNLFIEGALLFVQTALTVGNAAGQGIITCTDAGGSTIFEANGTTGTTSMSIAKIVTDIGMTLTNQVTGAGASAGTLGNAPEVGNPTFWWKVNINTGNYAIPCWPWAP